MRQPSNIEIKTKRKQPNIFSHNSLAYQGRISVLKTGQCCQISGYVQYFLSMVNEKNNLLHVGAFYKGNRPFQNSQCFFFCFEGQT